MPTEAQSLLIRLIAHSSNNPHLIDKLIIIRGLPYEWVFKKSKYRIENLDGTFDEGVSDQLLTPWESDVDVNIPRDVRDRTEPITYVKWFPEVRHQDKTYHGFWDKRTVWGLRLDLGFGPAQELWSRIEEYLYQSIPRAEKVPEPVQVALDQKSPFKTYLARRGRNSRSIELLEMDVPIIDLRKAVVMNETTATVAPVQVLKTVMTVPSDPTPPGPIEEKVEESIFKCECGQEFKNTHGLKIHKSVHKREKVKV